MRPDGMEGRFRGLSVLVAIALSSMLLTSCASNSVAPPAVTGTHSYMQTAPSAVIWLNLDLGQRVSGISQEVVGPGLTKDRKTHRYTDRIVGSLSGDTLTFTMVPNTSGDPWGGVTSKATISTRSIVMKGLTGDAFTAATNQQFQVAVSGRMPQWEKQQVQFAERCPTRTGT